MHSAALLTTFITIRRQLSGSNQRTRLGISGSWHCIHQNENMKWHCGFIMMWSMRLLPLIKHTVMNSSLHSRQIAITTFKRTVLTITASQITKDEQFAIFPHDFDVRWRQWEKMHIAWVKFSATYITVDLSFALIPTCRWRSYFMLPSVDLIVTSGYLEIC